MNESVHGLYAGEARADEDRGHDKQPCPTLGEVGAKCEGDAQRKRGKRIAEVVNHVSQQRNAAACEENDNLKCTGDGEHTQRQRDSANTLARAFDALIDQPVRVPMTTVVLVAVGVSRMFIAGAQRL